MGILLVAVFLGAGLLAGLLGGLSLALVGVLAGTRGRAWSRLTAIALLLSGLCALDAFLAFTSAQGKAGISMTASYERVFHAAGSLGASAGSGITALIARLIAFSDRSGRRP